MVWALYSPLTALDIDSEYSAINRKREKYRRESSHGGRYASGDQSMEDELHRLKQ